MWRLDVSAEAEVEIFEAALRYEREKSGLGFRFEADLGRVFIRLGQNPLQFPDIETQPPSLAPTTVARLVANFHNLSVAPACHA